MKQLTTDKNKQNNYFENLRWSSMKNNGLRVNNTSNVKGVSFKKKDKCWIASICDNDGQLRSKCFSIRKYDNAKQLATAWRMEKEIEFGYAPV